MAQHDYDIANQSGASFRADLNNALSAAATNNSGASAPSTTYAYQWWADTTTGLLKIRNAANTAWVTVGTLASTNLGLATVASPTFTGTPVLGTATGTSLTLTGDLQSASHNGGPLAGMRNRIINGAMAIDQRNAAASQTFTAAAALAYSVDRWYGYCTGANVTGQQISGATAGQFRYRFTGAASVTAIGFGQRIEQSNSAELANTTAILSADLANSLLTSVTWTAYYATTANTFGTLASPTRTQIATGTFTVNSTVTRYSTTISVPAAATTGIEIVFTVGAQTSGTWTIGDVQLEPGTVATPFERRSYGQELALCQRYFQILQNASGGRAESATLINLPFNTDCTMRAAPSATIVGTIVVRDISGTTTRTANSPASPTLTIANSTGGYLEFNSSSYSPSNFTTGNLCALACSSGTNGIALSAEL